MRKTHLTQLSVLIGFAIISGCSTPKTDNTVETTTETSADNVQKEVALYDEVIAIHDEVMPKMDDIMNFKGKLQERLDSLNENNLQGEMTEKITELIKALNEADEGMMSWMRNFKPKDTSEDHRAIMNYYEDQKKKITEVKDQMNTSLAEAEKLLKGEE